MQQEYGGGAAVGVYDYVYIDAIGYGPNMTVVVNRAGQVKKFHFETPNLNAPMRRFDYTGVVPAAQRADFVAGLVAGTQSLPELLTASPNAILAANKQRASDPSFFLVDHFYDPFSDAYWLRLPASKTSPRAAWNILR